MILKALSPRPVAPLSSFTIASFKSLLMGMLRGKLPANEEVQLKNVGVFPGMNMETDTEIRARVRRGRMTAPKD